MQESHVDSNVSFLGLWEGRLPSRKLALIALLFSVTLNAIFLVNDFSGNGDMHDPKQNGKARLLKATDSNSDESDPTNSQVNTGAHAGEHAQGHGSSEQDAAHAAHSYHTYPGLTFLIICFATAGLMDYVNRMIPEEYRPPYTVVLFLVGMALGPLGLTKPHLGANGSMVEGAAEGIHMFSQLDAHVMLFVFLPILLYESASNMTWHVFRRVLPSSILMAVPGVVINILLLGVVFYFMNDGGEVRWSLPSCLLLASVLSATDPVAVVAALQALGAPKKLSTLVEGESLLNDGSAMVAFYVFLDMVTKPGSVTFGTVMRDFVRLAVGGAGFGFIAAKSLIFCLHRIRDLHVPLIEVAFVVFFVYGTFFIAEQDPFKFSGVIAVVTLGTTMSAGGLLVLSHHGAHAHHTVICQIAYFCNQSLFLIAGVICERFMFASSSAKKGYVWGHLVILYIMIHLSRGFVTILFSPFLKRHGYGVNWKEMVILVFGGLRGAVGLAMALMVESNKGVDREVAEILVFHVSGIVLFTLLINGSTVDQLYAKLKLYPANPFRMVYVDKALQKLEKECQKSIEQAQDDWFFGDVDFGKLVPCLPDFSRVGFDHAGRIVFRKPMDVFQTLHQLEDEAQAYRQKHKQSPQGTVSISLAESIKHKPQGTSQGHHKSQKLWATVQQAVSPHHIMSGTTKKIYACNADTFVQTRCVNVEGGKQIIMSGGEAQKVGLYVSARTLTQIGHGHKFRVWLSNHNTVTVGVVGPQTGDGTGFFGTDYELGLDETPPEFGTTPYSVGIRCSDGKIIYHDGVKQAHLDPTCEAVLQEGDCVTVIIEGTELGSQVRFKKDKINLGCVALDRILPTTLKPMVELRALKSTDSTSSATSNGHRMTMFQQVQEAVVDFVQGEDEEDTNHTSVVLSFEPQISSAAETANELFHVLFNALRRQYQHLHDHGNLSARSLLVLSEALECAEDCSNHEANTEKVIDVLKEVRNRGTVAPHLSSIQHLSSKFHLTVPRLQSTAGAWQAHISTRAARWMHRFDDTPLLRRDQQKRTMHKTEYEPLLIEYLTLEEYLATESFFDKFQNRWMRQFGYNRLRSKVEAIWAYVSAHMLMLEELPSVQDDSLKRFPELVRYLNEVVADTKQDLVILQKMQPRRYFYAKHFIALRFMLSIKLHKLETFGAEGWLPQQDLEALTESLRDTLLDIQRFHPGAGRQDVQPRHSLASVAPCPES